MDWIDEYLAYTAGRPTPELFRLWSGIMGVAAALERRVWLRNRAGCAFPNLYVLLTAPPAIGKDMAIDPVVELWNATKGKIKLAPDSTTKASLLDEIEKTVTAMPINGGSQLYRYHALTVGNPEFGNFVNEYDTVFLGVLISLFNGKPMFRETRRTARNGQPLELENPLLNMLTASQPAALARLIPEEAWGMGFMSRMLIIYSATKPKIKLWDMAKDTKDEAVKQRLVSGLHRMLSMFGEYTFSPECVDFHDLWEASGFDPKPTHSRLEHYNERRGLIWLKLCIVAAASRSSELRITIPDMRRAQDWMLAAELHMPDAFRDMVGRSDKALLQELHQELWRIYIRGSKNPIHETRIFAFIGNRAPVEKVARIIEIAERSGVMQREAGTTNMYRPLARPNWEE